jgi:FdhD protein
MDKDTLRENTVDIHVNGIHVMRITCTPTDIYELVVGRLRSEGYISSIECIETLDMDCTEDLCSVRVFLHRRDMPGESCHLKIIPTTGGNGDIKSSYALPDVAFEPYDPIVWDANTIFALYESFALDTPLHSLTKGTHSCRLAVDGTIVFTSEDIGRHNAFDKAIGYSLVHSLDISRTVFFVSGRIPVDMVSKALRARIPVLASKAAPSDQAVKLAKKYGLTLVCLVNNDQLLVFSGAEFERSSSRFVASSSRFVAQ